MKKKLQHIIPRCYQRAWCDPETPLREEPFVWLVSRDGKSIRRKAPRNVFTETDAYTIRLSDGSRNLIIEDTFSGIEGKFSELRDVIGKRDLSEEQRGILCLFTAAMFSRTLDQRDNWSDNFSRLRDMTRAVEDAYETNHGLSETADVLVRHAHPYSISWVLESMPSLLMGMTLTILQAADEVGFITSDNPCLIMNPHTHKWPPIFRNPGLLHPNTEVIMPVSPSYCVGFSHYWWLRPVVALSQKKLREMNRTMRDRSRESIVSRSKEVDEYWFRDYELPEDAWEKTNQPGDLQVNPIYSGEMPWLKTRNDK